MYVYVWVSVILPILNSVNKFWAHMNLTLSEGTPGNLFDVSAASAIMQSMLQKLPGCQAPPDTEFLRMWFRKPGMRYTPIILGILYS